MDKGAGYLSALAAGWAAYFAIHSLLAADGVKAWVTRRCPGMTRVYRLLYNLLALLFLLPPVYFTTAWEGPWLWRWQGPAAWAADGLALAAVAGFLWSLRYYSGAEFLGLHQWRAGAHGGQPDQHLYISPLHRYVRHPWYFFGLVLLWTRDMDAARLVTAGVITVYFVLGSWLEEQKLMRYHGAAYRRYRSQVPGLVPRPWHRLSKRQAAELVALSRQKKAPPCR